MRQTARTKSGISAGDEKAKSTSKPKHNMIAAAQPAISVATAAIFHIDHSSTFLMRCTLAIITMIGVDPECVHSLRRRESLMFDCIAERA